MRIMTLLAVAVSLLVTQDKKKVTLETMSDPSLLRALTTPRIWWFDDNTAAVYDTRKPAAERTLERWDPETGKRTPMYDLAKATESLKQYFPDGKAPTLAPIPSGVTGSGSRGYYLLNGDVFVVEMNTGSVQRITNTPEEEKSVNFSPDGKKIAFVRKNNLYAYDIDQKQEWPLTSDGSPTVLNGTLSWVYWEEIFGRRDIGYWWSNDSKSVAFLRSDESGVSVQNFVDFEPWTPTVQTQRYPKVGQKNPEVKVGVADLGGSAARWIALDPASYEYIMRVDWMPDNKRLCVRSLNRLQTDLSFWFVDRSSGTCTFVMKDTDPGWINMTDDLYFLKGEESILSSMLSDTIDRPSQWIMIGSTLQVLTLEVAAALTLQPLSLWLLPQTFPVVGSSTVVEPLA